MTKLKRAAILGGLMVAGFTLLTSFPASGGSGFLPVKSVRLVRACRAIEGVDGSICKAAAGVVDKLTSEDPEAPPTPEQLERGVRKMRSFVRRSLRQECCDAPCVRECSGGKRGCFDDSQCPSGQTCLPCEAQPCETFCEEFKGDRCGGCLQMVQNLESWLASNQSARLLSDVLGTACDGRFADPSECKLQIGQSVPIAIDELLANAPPTTACGPKPGLNACRP